MQQWSEPQVIVADSMEAAVYIACDSTPNGINAKYKVYDFVPNEGFDLYDPHYAEYDVSNEEWAFY